MESAEKVNQQNKISFLFMLNCRVTSAINRKQDKEGKYMKQLLSKHKGTVKNHEVCRSSLPKINEGTFWRDFFLLNTLEASNVQGVYRKTDVFRRVCMIAPREQIEGKIHQDGPFSSLMLALLKEIQAQLW